MTTGFPIFNILGHFRGVNWHEVKTDLKPFEIPKADDLEFTAVPLKSEAPPYSPHRHNTVPGDNVGYRVLDKKTGFHVSVEDTDAVGSKIKKIIEKDNYFIIAIKVPNKLTATVVKLKKIILRFA